MNVRPEDLTESDISKLLDAIIKHKSGREVQMIRGTVVLVTGGICEATIAGGEIAVPMRMAEGLGLAPDDEVYIFATGADKVVGFKLEP